MLNSRTKNKMEYRNRYKNLQRMELIRIFCIRNLFFFFYK